MLQESSERNYEQFSEYTVALTEQHNVKNFNSVLYGENELKRNTCYISFMFYSEKGQIYIFTAKRIAAEVRILQKYKNKIYKALPKNEQSGTQQINKM